MSKQYICPDKSKTRDEIVQIMQSNLNTDVDKLNDNLIFGNIKEYLNQFKQRNTDRIGERSKSITKLLFGKPISSYLDYGCGDGSITAKVGEDLGLTKDLIYGIDIKAVENENITTVVRDDLVMFGQQGKKFDLITCLVSMHHFEKLNNELSLISSLTAEGGYLIIREHDLIETPAEVKADMICFLNLVHLWNDFLLTGASDLKKYDKTIYRNAKAWGKILYKYGFKFIRQERYNKNNPQCLYYALYKKII
jgi:SAM-dependent methyltransferase